MNKKQLWVSWGVIYFVTVCMGALPDPGNVLKAFMALAAIGFFVPPGVLLYCSYKEKDLATAKWIFWISIVSLCLTTVFLVANILSVFLPEGVGNVLYAFLLLVSAPMVASQVWVLSMFAWACLMVTSRKLKSQGRK